MGSSCHALLEYGKVPRSLCTVIPVGLHIDIDLLLYISMLATYVLHIVYVSIVVPIFLLFLHFMLQIIYNGLWNLLLINANFRRSPLSLLYPKTEVRSYCFYHIYYLSNT